jgi:hypothetical protein
MMTQKIIDNLSKENNDAYDFGSAPSGYGTQFILRSSAVISQVKVKLAINVWGTTPTGTLTARIYGSHTGNFRDISDYAESLIAESTDSINVANLEATISNETLTFDDVSLAPGVYFLCFFTSDLATNDGDVRIFGTNYPSSVVGSLTVWSNDDERWISYLEWD